MYEFVGDTIQFMGLPIRKKYSALTLGYYSIQGALLSNGVFISLCYFSQY